MHTAKINKSLTSHVQDFGWLPRVAFSGGFLDPVGVGHGVPQPVSHDDGVVVVRRVVAVRHRFELGMDKACK